MVFLQDKKGGQFSSHSIMGTRKKCAQNIRGESPDSYISCRTQCIATVELRSEIEQMTFLLKNFPVKTILRLDYYLDFEVPIGLPHAPRPLGRVLLYGTYRGAPFHAAIMSFVNRVERLRRRKGKRKDRGKLVVGARYFQAGDAESRGGLRLV